MFFTVPKPRAAQKLTYLSRGTQNYITKDNVKTSFGRRQTTFSTVLQLARRKGKRNSILIFFYYTVKIPTKKLDLFLW